MRSVGERVKAVMKVGEYRKVTSLAKSLRVRRADIEECIHDVEGLDLIVGVRAGSGVGDLDPSDYEIERYE